MSELKTRVEREAELYDSGALDRTRLERLLEFVDEGIGKERRNAVIRREMAPAQGGDVLEIGSQAWEWCVHRNGYVPRRLCCINISEAELDAGRAHAAARGIDADFRKMDAHELAFGDASFDCVFGVAILHHLEFDRAMREIHRVLRPGGSIMFVEPLILNPVARVARALTPGARTLDERPLGRAELALVDRYFESRNYYSELFTVPGGILSGLVFRAPVNPVTRLCDWLDHALLRVLPALGPYYRSVVVAGTKR